MKRKTTIWLDEIDDKAIQAIKEKYRVATDSAAIRLALSLIAKEIEKEDKKGKR